MKYKEALIRIFTTFFLKQFIHWMNLNAQMHARIYLYSYSLIIVWHKVVLKEYSIKMIADSAGTVEYTDYFPAEG